MIGPSWVGDMVMAQSLFRVLRNRQPDIAIEVLAPPWSGPILARMPEVEGAIPMSVGHGRLGLSQRWRLAKTLKGRFDQAIILPGSFKSALVPWLAGIMKRTGLLGEQRFGLINDRRKLSTQRMPYNVQRFVALGDPKDAPVRDLSNIPRPKLEIDQENRDRLVRQYRINPTEPLYILCPGAEFGPAKQWPGSHFAAVARNRLDAGGEVLLLGSEKDQDIAGAIAEQAPGCQNLTGKTALADVVDLMSMASHVVSNDSGLMHIAAATDCHVIALYGSSTDTFTPPLTSRADRLYLDLPCRPCFQRNCPLGHLNCLNALDPARVISIFG